MNYAQYVQAHFAKEVFRCPIDCCEWSLWLRCCH